MASCWCGKGRQVDAQEPEVTMGAIQNGSFVCGPSSFTPTPLSSKEHLQVAESISADNVAAILTPRSARFVEILWKLEDTLPS